MTGDLLDVIPTWFPHPRWVPAMLTTRSTVLLFAAAPAQSTNRYTRKKRVNSHSQMHMLRHLASASYSVALLTNFIRIWNEKAPQVQGNNMGRQDCWWSCWGSCWCTAKERLLAAKSLEALKLHNQMPWSSDWEEIGRNVTHPNSNTPGSMSKMKTIWEIHAS